MGMTTATHACFTSKGRQDGYQDGHQESDEDAVGESVMSIQASRDARCNGTDFFLEARIVLGALVYRHTRCPSILELVLFQHISLQR
jgi:hypothetical protein